MASSKAALYVGEGVVANGSRRRDAVELAISFSLILLVIWTPRPWQVLLWFVAAAFVGTVTCLRFEGFEAMGLRAANLFQSLWVVGVALAASAVAITVAARLHTLHTPGTPLLFIEHYWGYALWSGVQQFMLQCFLMSRLLRLLQDATSAAAIAAVMFAFTHLPSLILTPVTLICGMAACLVFLRYRNLYTVAMAHAILGISLAITIPGPVDHNMRVGLGYLTYSPNRTPSAQP